MKTHINKVYIISDTVYISGYSMCYQGAKMSYFYVQWEEVIEKRI